MPSDLYITHTRTPDIINTDFKTSFFVQQQVNASLPPPPSAYALFSTFNFERDCTPLEFFLQRIYTIELAAGS